MTSNDSGKLFLNCIKTEKSPLNDTAGDDMKDIIQNQRDLIHEWQNNEIM